MLLDPLEEQFDLPAATIELGNGERRKGEVVAQKDQSLSAHGVLEADAPQRVWETLTRVKDGEHHRLIADQPGRALDVARVAAVHLKVGLAASHEITAGQVHPVQPLEIEIAPIHDVESARLGHKLIEDIDLVHLAVADVKERGNIAAQIEQRVELDGRLG